MKSITNRAFLAKKKMYKTPTTEQVTIEHQSAIMSASGEKKQTTVTPAELWSGKLN